MKTIVLLAGLGFLFGSQAFAQTDNTRKLTLKEAVEMGLKNNKQLKANKTKVIEAALQLQEASERRLPDAGISGAYLYLPVNPNINLKTGKPDSSGSSSSTPKVHQAIYGIANVSVPLYTGGKLKYGIETAKLLEEAAKSDLEEDVSTEVLNITNACITVFKAQQAIDLVQEFVDQSRQRVKDLSNLEKNGLLARNDLLKAQLQESNTELSLLDAQSNYKIACVSMDLLIGLPEETILVPDKSGLSLPDSVRSLLDYEQDALKNRKDISALSSRTKAAEVGIKLAKADLYPDVAFTGGYVAADIPGFLTITNAVNVGIGVKYNLSSLWKTKTKVKEAYVKVEEYKVSQDMLTDNIRLQLNKAYETYLVSVKKIEVYNLAVEQATENYRIVTNKFNNSLATTTEVLDANVALFQSKLSVTNAKADSFLAYARLLDVAGALKF